MTVSIPEDGLGSLRTPCRKADQKKRVGGWEKQKQEALSKAVYLPLRLYFGSAIQIETLRWRDLDRQLTGLLTITQ